MYSGPVIEDIELNHAYWACKEAEIIAYEDLGPEAIRKLMVEDFPVVVINDCRGRDLYKEGRKQYERS